MNFPTALLLHQQNNSNNSSSSIALHIHTAGQDRTGNLQCVRLTPLSLDHSSSGVWSMSGAPSTPKSASFAKQRADEGAESEISTVRGVRRRSITVSDAHDGHFWIDLTLHRDSSRKLLRLLRQPSFLDNLREDFSFDQSMAKTGLSILIAKKTHFRNNTFLAEQTPDSGGNLCTQPFPQTRTR